MQNPAGVVNLLVEKLRTINEVVNQVGGDPANVYAYKDAPPAESSLSRAIYQMVSPSVMVAWMGSGAAQDGLGLFGHDISMFVRADDSTEPGKPTFANIVTAIMNGVPAGDSIKLLNAQLTPYLALLEVPTIRRIHDEEGTIDLFEISTRVDDTWDTDDQTNKRG